MTTTTSYTQPHIYTQRQLLALCPKTPNTGALPLPASVQELSEIFIQSSSENLQSSNITEQHNSGLLKPILLLKLSERDREMLKHPIISGNAGPKKHQPGSTHSRQNPSSFYDKNQHHHSGRGRGGHPTRRHLVPFDTSTDDHHELESFRKKPDYHGSTRPRPRRTEDSTLTYENINDDQEDPWADPTETPGKFDEHGNFVPFDTQEHQPKEESESSQKAKQSRFASLLNEREEKQHTLLQTAPPMTIPDDWVLLPFFNAWTYCDPSAKIQGPFIAQQMYEWTRIGYFTPSLLVKPDLSQVPEKDYKFVLSPDLTNSYNPLSKWIEKYRCYPWSIEAKSARGPKLEQISTPKLNNNVDAPLSIDSAIVTMKKEKTSFSGWQIPKVDKIPLETDEQKSNIENLPNKVDKAFESTSHYGTEQPMKMSERSKNGIENGIGTRQHTSWPKNVTRDSISSSWSDSTSRDTETDASIKQNVTSWSSVAASHKQAAVNATPKGNNVKKIVKAEPVIEERNVVNDANDPLIQWVTEELERCKIKDLDIPTFVGCIRDLSERDLEDVVPVYIPSGDAGKFIQKFIRNRSVVLGQGAKYDKTEGKQSNDGKKDEDGFSLVSRNKPRKPKQHAATSTTKKTVVGLVL